MNKLRLLVNLLLTKAYINCIAIYTLSKNTDTPKKKYLVFFVLLYFFTVQNSIAQLSKKYSTPLLTSAKEATFLY